MNPVGLSAAVIAPVIRIFQVIFQCEYIIEYKSGRAGSLDKPEWRSVLVSSTPPLPYTRRDLLY